MAHDAGLPLFINEMPLVSYVSPIDTAYSAEQLSRSITSVSATAPSARGR